jgi:hypothetical protein
MINKNLRNFHSLRSTALDIPLRARGGRTEMRSPGGADDDRARPSKRRATGGRSRKSSKRKGPKR